MSTHSNGLKVFYSYSHRDEKLKDELDKHLSLLQRQKLITAWHDRKITAGTEWKDAIDSNFAASDIILLLVSADFMASDYCYDLEMKLALEKHQANEATVIPVILRSVDWSNAPFAHIQALPRDGKPVTAWPDQDEAFTSVAKGIKDAIKMRLENQQEQQPPLSAVEIPFVEGQSLESGEPESNKVFDNQLPNQINAQVVAKLIARIAEGFTAELHMPRDLSEPLRFKLELKDVHLRGADKPIPCMAVWTSQNAIDSTLNSLASEAQSSFGIVFCFSQDAYRELSALQRADNYCVLSPPEVSQLLYSHCSIKLLLEQVVGQIGIRRVSPYNMMLPAVGSMFFGRTAELNALFFDRDASYAIVGSSRIGKSSLMMQYRHLSLRSKQSFASGQFFINMSSCRSDSDSDSISRFIAINIDPSSRSSRVRQEDFISFIRYQVNKHGAPIEILLDEVDHICHAPAFEHLGEAAKLGLIRLIVCGRGELMKFAMNPQSRFGLRLHLLRPGPLEWAVAQRVLIAPMKDLGISYEREEIVDHVCQMTGGLPFLLQYYARALVNKAEQSQTNVLTSKMIEEFEWEFDTVEFMMRPLLEIQDAKEKALALNILKSSRFIFSAAEISAMISNDDGNPLGAHEVISLCNALCIHGVLVYVDGKFNVANKALRDLALKSGYLDLLS